MSDIERTQFDFQSQDEFTELLFLINGSTAQRSNWGVMKSPASIYRLRPHIIKTNNSIIPFLVLHNNKKNLSDIWKQIPQQSAEHCMKKEGILASLHSEDIRQFCLVVRKIGIRDSACLLYKVVTSKEKPKCSQWRKYSCNPPKC